MLFNWDGNIEPGIKLCYKRNNNYNFFSLYPKNDASSDDASKK